MKDFRYANPPLLEVVVEIHWKITGLGTFPGASIDPHFELFAPAMAARLKDAGFGFHENLRMNQAPIELFSHIVTSRYRRGAGEWPAIQIGPGVLTVNMVPPYEGWKSFRSYVNDALSHLFASYPIAERYLKIETIQLRYIDAFGTKHGFGGQFGTFMNENFNVGVMLPKEITQSAQSTDNIVTLLDVRVPISSPTGAIGEIKIAPGMAQDQTAVVAEFSVSIVPPATAPVEPEGIMQWLDEAHSTVRTWFMSFPTKKLVSTFGDEINL